MGNVNEDKYSKIKIKKEIKNEINIFKTYIILII